MKNTEVLKQNAEKLQSKIDILFNEFYQENGECEIDVIAEEVSDAMGAVISKKVKVEVTV